MVHECGKRTTPFLKDPQGLKITTQDFPGGPVVKTLYSQSRGLGSILGQGTKIHAYHMAQPKKIFNGTWKFSTARITHLHHHLIFCIPPLSPSLKTRVNHK